MHDFDGALRDYERTLELSPKGFFTAHVAVDTLRREKRGELPRGFYLAYAMLEQMDDRHRRDAVAQLVDKAPGFARGWLDYEKLATTLEERLRRIERGLAAQPDAQTHGMLKLNQALVLQNRSAFVVTYSGVRPRCRALEFLSTDIRPAVVWVQRLVDGPIIRQHEARPLRR